MADDQRPESFDGQADELADDLLLPAGDMLDHEDSDVEAFEIVDEDAEELQEDASVIDDTPGEADPEDMVIEDEQQLTAAEGVAAKARSTRPVKKSSDSSARPVRKPVSKESLKVKTPKRDDKVVPARKRTGPVTFSKQAVGELRKVLWPTGDQLRQYFIVVLVFVLFIVFYVSALDVGFGRLLLWLLGE